MTRIHKLTLACLATLLGVLAAIAPPAGAIEGYVNLCPSLATALCSGALHNLESVGVDNSSQPSQGDVWVANAGTDLLKFDASGNMLAEIGESGIPGSARQIFGTLQLNAFTTVAVDPADGAVYLSQITPTHTITKFDAAGNFQFQLTGSETPQGSFAPSSIAVNSSGDLYVIDGEHEVIDEFDSSGKYLSQFPAPFASAQLAFDSKDNSLYLGSASAQGSLSGGFVGRYTPAGMPLDCPGGNNLVFTGASTGNATIDASDGHVFFAEKGFISEAASFCAAQNAKTGAEAPGGHIGEGEFEEGLSAQMDVNDFTHELYAGENEARDVKIFGLVLLPDVATEASPTGITRTSASVSGSVDPDGTAITACQFEYGTTTAYGHSVPCSQTVPFTGSGPVDVSAELTLLLPPASLVHYRLKAANANGSDDGEDHTFYTEALPSPVVGGLSASAVSQFAATLQGTLATGEALVNYRFEYGTTTGYGQVVPIPDNYTPITDETLTVSQSVQGLQAGTTYHYRLVASSPGGTEVAGPDEVFTTLAIPVPTVVTGGAGGVAVGSATLPGSIDPHGWDTTYLFQYGTTSAYGASWPTVPVEMGALEGPQPVVVNVPNLLPDTVYHYRLVAINGGGTSYGQDLTFTTDEYSPQIVQEPPALGTLLVPSEPGKVTTSTPKKAKTKGKTRAKKGAKHKKRSRAKRRRRGPGSPKSGR